jgi:hypothetical protein
MKGIALGEFSQGGVGGETRSWNGVQFALDLGGVGAVEGPGADQEEECQEK